MIQAKSPVTVDTNPPERQRRAWWNMLDVMERFPNRAPYNWLVYFFTTYGFEPFIALVKASIEEYMSRSADECVE